MIVKIFGILDIITAALFLLFIYTGFIPSKIIIIFALYVLTKGILFLISKDIASTLDIISGIIILASTTIILHPAIVILTSIFLLQKGVFSLLS